jgi:hypothetical protein
MGRMVEVEIVECGKHSMKGKIIDTNGYLYPSRPLQLKRGEVSGLSKVSVA